MNRRLRAFRQGDETRVEKGYWARNRDIVDETDVVVACPRKNTCESDWRKSGTWYTVKYGHDNDRPVFVVTHDGIGAGRAAPDGR